MNESFKRNLIITYGLSLFLVIISSVASYMSIHNLLEGQELVDHTNNVIMKLEQISSALKDGETGQRGYLLTGRTEFLDPYNGARDRALTTLNEVEKLTLDNPRQQQSLQQLRDLVVQRFALLRDIIDAKKRGVANNEHDLTQGKVQMDEIRRLVTTMQDREQALLTQRTEKTNRFAAYTPVLIIIASLLSLLVAIVSFLRVNADYDRRVVLQRALEQKDIDTSNRLAIIQGIADKISGGNYQVRVSDEGKDVLGSLGVALNKMAQSLDYSFATLSHKEWTQTGIASLNEKMIGEKQLDVLAYSIIEFITDYTSSQVGAVYLLKDEETLGLTASYGLNKDSAKKTLFLGEELAGQAALSGKDLLLENIADAALVVNHTAGSIKPQNIIAIPLMHERRLKGVMELATLGTYSPVVREFLKIASYNIGQAIHSAQDHQRLQDLLAETQAQSEELQSQHSELENINTELEAQSQKLQASEEELRVQQEELQQANQELEERSRLLEEKNELILERNFEIQAKAEELAQTTKYKSEFLANMSHELRTPLNSILLLSRLLSENHAGNLLSDQIEYATVIRSSGNGLLTLIDEILDLSKIESGKMELEYEFVGIEDVTREMDSLFGPIAKDKNITFRIAAADDLPKMLETDRLRLQQILRNLISNALKFTARGAVTLHITKDAHTISFAVQDTGIGIPADKQQTVFEAFQQADGSTRRKYGGSGLGLSISRELAKLLGGEISLHSEEGKGSTFTLTLPLQKGASIHPAKPIIPAPVQEEITASQQEKLKEDELVKDPQFLSEHIPPAVPDDRDTITAGEKVILIIEDDTAFARSLLDYTRQKGYKGIVAVRGDEGVELARRFRPLGILLDIQLPVKTGWEVMEELKADAATRPIPVHMMSSYQAKTRSLSRGAVDFINKPVDIDKLSDVFLRIEQALSRHPKKVLIVEENQKHAQALAYYLDGFNVHTQIRTTVGDGITALNRSEVDCVILDMGVPAQHSYDVLEEVKKSPGYENLPIIVFTGRNLSHVEEMRIKQYADSIVVKTAHSYQRILDEVSLFLHLVEENTKDRSVTRYKRMGALSEVLKGKVVLVADDDVRNIFSLTKSLEAYGMKVISAIDGREALKQLDETPNVDLVLMDMMMPEMDGYEATRRIRQMHKYRNLPVIAVTAKAMTGDREKCINAGASDYITKPVDVDQLVSLLRVWLYE